MLKCAPIITPNAVRTALDLAFDLYLGTEHERRGEDFFERQLDYSRISGAMLAGKLSLWGCADGELRAVAALEDNCRVGFIFVEESYRRHGLGEALIEAMCDTAREEKLGTLYAWSTRESEGFFEALGFEICGESDDRYGVEVTPVKLEL